MSRANSPRDRIFISYRRDDTQGYAGRLEDSLADYFGAQRVFRDVGGIAGGDDFSAAIDKELGDAGAVVVLIGRHWLDTARERHGRCEDSMDYVSIEVAGALAKGIPVVPVLVEHADMPRKQELPEPLEPLALRNAISLSDERWKTDVERLAKVLAIDVPGSLAELRLNRLRGAILALLLVPLVLQVAAFSIAAYRSAADGVAFDVSTQASQIFNPARFSWAMPTASFIAIMTACYLLMLAARHIDRAKLKFIRWSIWAGGLGSLAAFLFYGLADADHPARIIGVFVASVLVTATMLALMMLSGFRSP